MKLQDFFPYRLAVASEAVSRSIAQVYAERFDLSRDEWRVLAALADLGEIKTAQVIESATLDKMQVSRAVTRLVGSGLIARAPDPADARGHRLRLLPAGRALHRQIVPGVQAREEFLLSELLPAERSALQSALGKVLQRAQQLSDEG
jgi:DNA-binding MarR family transcriptional regulator